MLGIGNLGILTALFLVMLATRFRSEETQGMLGVFAAVAILAALGLLSTRAFEFYAPGLMMFFGLCSLYAKGSAQLVSMLLTISLLTTI